MGLLHLPLSPLPMNTEHSLGVLDGNELMLEQAIAHCPLQVVVQHAPDLFLKRGTLYLQMRLALNGTGVP